MNKRYIFTIMILILGTQVISAQENKLTLKECILSALQNKASILALKAEQEISFLKSDQIKANYRPQISLAYDYLYNPIIKTNIVPVGKFNPTPTNEVQPIRFGTKWQQTAGMKVIQPLFTPYIKGQLNESKIQEKITIGGVDIANDDLVAEVAKSFINLLLKEQQANESVYDTLRTFQILTVSKERYVNGKSLKTDWNKARINHNSMVNIYQELTKEMLSEKIYLAFLTHIPYNDMLIDSNDALLTNEFLNWLNLPAATDSLAVFQQMENKIMLVNQQIKNERLKYLPSVSLNGYIGSDQFFNRFNLLLTNTWFGNSFVGLSIRWPLLSGENRSNNLKQLQFQIKSYELQQKELTEEVKKERAMVNNEIRYLQAKYRQCEENTALYKESLHIYQERLNQGQQAVADINNEEFEYQKESQNLNRIKSEIWLRALIYLKTAGLLGRLYQ